MDHFRNKAVVTDPAKLRKLIKATDDYLGERELLRPLQKLGGEMSGRVKAGKLDKHASKAVTAVVGKLAEFEERINYDRVGTFRSRPDREDSPSDW